MFVPMSAMSTKLMHSSPFRRASACIGAFKAFRSNHSPPCKIRVPMKVLILGAGVAGVASAWYLWRDGHDVTVLERNQAVALETSFANGGQLSYSYVAPLASPSVIPKLPPWLLRRDSPLRFKPELDPDQWRWCLEFLAACRQSTADETTRRLLRLAFYSRDLMHQLVREQSIDFDYVHNGKLVVHTQRESFESAVQLMEYQRTLGAEQRALDPVECVEIEPALADMSARIVGAIHTPSEEAGATYKFRNEPARLMAAGPTPATIHLRAEVGRLLPWRGKLMGMETSIGVLEADHYVL